MLMRPTLLFLAIGLAVLLFSIEGANAAGLVQGRFAYTFKEKEYPTSAAACTALLQTLSTPERLKAAYPPDEYGNVRCTGVGTEQVSGFDMYMNGVSYELICPAGSREDRPPEKSRLDPFRCECESNLIAVGGATCQTAQEVAQSKSTPRSKEELLATPQRRSEEGCGLTKAEQQAIAAILGKRFSNVPQFNKAWLAAVDPSHAKAVAILKPNPATNKDNRGKYFKPTRERFWKNVFDDRAKGGAYELITRSGATIAKRGNAAKLSINGKIQGLDIDHLVGLAEDPTRMISVDNLQLSPLKENRDTLEEIARLDPFYDPDEWLRKQAAVSCPVKP